MFNKMSKYEADMKDFVIISSLLGYIESTYEWKSLLLIDKTSSIYRNLKLKATARDFFYDPWVEASAGGLLIPEGLYSPVAMYYVTSLKYGYVCNSKIRNSYQN